MKTNNKDERARRRALDAAAILPPDEVIAQAEAYISLAYRPHFHRALRRRAEAFKVALSTSDHAVEMGLH